MSAPRKPSLFGRLLLLFTIVPVIELTLLVWLGEQIGLWPTVGLIAATAVIGSALAHREGLSALARFRARVASGDVPGDELIDGILILISGAFLLTPGVLTDVVGFLGLLPPTRAIIKRIVSKRIKQSLLSGSVSVSTWPPTPPPETRAEARVANDDNVVDVEVVDIKHEA